MTLKEELSLDRKKVINDLEEKKELANEEMRKIIKDYINPIIKLMHNKSRTRQELIVIVEQDFDAIIGTIRFNPQITIDSSKYKTTYRSTFSFNELATAAFKVAPEFDLQADIFRSSKDIRFVMTLDD